MLQFKAITAVLESDGDECERAFDLLLKELFKKNRSLIEYTQTNLNLMPVMWGSMFFSDFFLHAAGRFFAAFVVIEPDPKTRQGLLNAFLKVSLNKCCAFEETPERIEVEKQLQEILKWILFVTDEKGNTSDRMAVDNDFLVVLDNAPFKEGKIIDYVALKNFMIDALGVCKFDDSGEAKAVWTGRGYEEGADAMKEILSEVFSSYDIPVNLETNVRIALQQFNTLYYTIKHAPCGFIPFKNGTLEILDPLAPFEEGKAYRFHSASRDLHVSRALAVNFNPGAACDEMERSFDEWATRQVRNKDGSKSVLIDKELRAIYEEVIGYVLLMSHNFKGLPLLYGKKNCGKSTFIDLVTNLVGKDQAYHIKLKDLNSKFNTSRLLRPRLYVGDDQSGGELSPDLQAFVKNAVSEGFFQMEDKFQTPFQGIIRGVGLFSANVLPCCSDYTCRRRFLIVPFLHEFKTSGKSADNLKALLNSPKALEYAALLGVRGAMRMMSRKGDYFAQHFTYSKLSEAAASQFDTESNTFMEWLPVELFNADVPNDRDFVHFLYKRNLGTNPEQEKYSINSFYKKYKDYCDENELKGVFTLRHFKQALIDYFPDQNIIVEMANIGSGKDKRKKAFWVIPDNPSYSINHRTRAQD